MKMINPTWLKKSYQPKLINFLDIKLIQDLRDVKVECVGTKPGPCNFSSQRAHWTPTTDSPPFIT